MIVAAGFVGAAALGALIRWQAGRLLPSVLGTLLVNVTGAFALGLLAGAGAPAVTVAGAGGLGTLTTLSTLAAELRHLAMTAPLKAVAYLSATLVGGLGAAWAGLTLAG